MKYVIHEMKYYFKETCFALLPYVLLNISILGILVRNNLTGIELVTFAGESVLGEFKFGKFRHDHHSSKLEDERESAILEFDMKEKHLKDCDRKHNL